MMGDRDFQTTIRNAITSISKELEIDIDANDLKTIHLKEVVQCLRRSYYDRVDRLDVEIKGFNELVSGLLKKFQYGTKPKEFQIDDIKLAGHADMIADDAILLFRSSIKELNDPVADDILYLNACMWIYDKDDGIIVYITGDRKEITFSLTRNKNMFEETVRRVRVLAALLEEKKPPVLEPSTRCTECQYYERCFTKKKNTKQTTIADMLGLSKISS